MEHLPQLLIIENGSQLTRNIERVLRELGYRSAILPQGKARDYVKKFPIKGVILSGGAASVYEKDAPRPPQEIFRIKNSDGEPVPILGICYGMQWIAKHFGGKVIPDPSGREYAKAELTIVRESALFAGTPRKQTVWASHGDSVTRTPKGFAVVGKTKNTIAAIADEKRRIFGVQFHPEMTHTRYGKTILNNFAKTICKCEKDWRPRSLVAEIQEQINNNLLKKEKAIIGFSGGVDSTTLAAIAAPVLKKRLLAVTIDAGNLRENELQEIRKHARAARIRHKVVNAQKLCIRTLSKTTGAEEKRKQFKKIYTAILLKESSAFGASVILQGTLAPDLIESGATGGAVIKSHHNVGLSFDRLKVIHPLESFFKYEVRALAKSIGLPQSVWGRQPFPGPGLFVRIIGAPILSEMLEIVRWADARVREILSQHSFNKNISQLVVARIGKAVGVKGDARVYGEAIGVRAVKTVDFMTAEGILFPSALQKEISTALTKHPHITAVGFFPTDKPPQTTEFE